MSEGTPKRRRLKGLGASSGSALGRAHLLAVRESSVAPRAVAKECLAAEVRRFRLALREAAEELRALRSRVEGAAGDPGAQILDSHLLILQDRDLVQEIVATIKDEQVDAAYAAQRAFLDKAEYFDSLASELFRARAADVRDVLRRVLARLDGETASQIVHAPQGSILVAREITPSETLSLGPEGLAGIVTEQGTLASHVTILARSRGVPAVIGVADALGRIAAGEPLLIDGDRGLVICSPDAEDIRRYERTRERDRRVADLIARLRREPGGTLDGRRLAVLANLERPEDAAAALRAGAEGVGLFRTEFLFMNGNSPGEEVQLAVYREVARVFANAPVTIRTLDLGGDKQSELLSTGPEENPFLGLRGIRFCLGHPEVFLAQLRAILRAAGSGSVRFLLPMISNLSELRETRAMIARTAEQLRNEGHAIPARVPVGVMIEVPSAVWMSDHLAREADYFSIGSNDLVQYCLAVDRGNALVAHLYDPLDPAVLRAIAQTADHAHAAGIPVASCGEMSGEIPGMLLLAGLGIDELSVSPFLIGRVKGVLAGVDSNVLSRVARLCLKATVVDDVRTILREELRIYPQFHFEERDGQFACFWDPEQH